MWLYIARVWYHTSPMFNTSQDEGIYMFNVSLKGVRLEYVYPTDTRRRINVGLMC